MATEFEKSVNSFQAKIDAKREALDKKAFEIKTYLNSPASIYSKKASLANASLTLENRYLNDPASKDFYSVFNRIESDTLDGDTIEITSPYESFYGGKEPKKQIIRLGSNDPGQSLDTYETAKYEIDESGNKRLLPYNKNKYDYHRIHYAKVNGLPNKDYVTQEMLNAEAQKQTQRLVEALYKGETWDDYGVKPNRGEAVPYPKEYQNQLDTLTQEFYKEADLLAGEQKITELSREGREAETINIIQNIEKDEIDGLAKNVLLGIDGSIDSIYKWFENRQDNTSLQKLKAIERKIHKVKFIANEMRPPIDASVLTGDVNVDIKTDGVGIYNRALGTLTNPETGDVLNDSLNNITNNAAYFSKYNKAYVDKILANVNEIARQPNPDGEGFLAEISNGLMGGYDNIQAVVYGMGMLIADWRGDTKKANEWMQKAHKELEQARSRGVILPTVEELDWTNPRAVLSKVGRTFGEGIPSIATMYGTGGIFGWLGKKGANKFVSKKISQEARDKSIANITRISQYSGAFVAANVLETGGIYLDVAAAGERDGRAQIMSFIGGSTAASLEAIFPASLFATKGASKVGTDAIKKKFIERLIPALANIGKQTASGASIEAVTEGLQFVVSEVTQELIKEGDLKNINANEFVSGIVNSMFAGAIPGGGIRTITSTLGGAKDVLLDSDRARTRERQQEIEQEARTAGEESIIGKNETRSLDEIVEDSGTELSTIVKEVLQATKGLNLNKGKDKTPISVAIKLLDELSKVDPTNAAIEKLEAAIKNYQSGSPKQQVAILQKVIENETIRELAALEQEYRVKKSKAIDDKEVEALNKEEKDKEALIRKSANSKLNRAARGAPINKANRAERTKISERVNEAIKLIQEINTKLNDPKLSKSERKRLERTRQAQATIIQNLSGTTELLPATKTAAEKALDSYDWFTNKVVQRTSNDRIKQAVEAVEETQDKLLKAINETVLDEETINTLMEELDVGYEQLKAYQDELLKAAQNTTQKREQKQLGTLIRGLEKQIKRVNATTQLVMNRENEELSKEGTETKEAQSKASDILNSLKIDVINKTLKLSKKVEKNLTKAEKNLYKLRNQIADLHVQINPERPEILGGKSNRGVVEVYKQVIEGDKKFTGLKDYLYRAENGLPFLSAFKAFKEHHNKKLEAFKKAENLVFNEGLDTETIVYVNKDTFKVDFNDDGNSWWVNSQSLNLVGYIEKEVEYINILGEYIDGVVLNRKAKNKVKVAKNQTKKIGEKIQSEIVQDRPATNKLDNKEFTDAVEEEPGTKPKDSKKQSAAVNTKSKKEEKQETSTIDELKEKEKAATDSISKLKATIARQEAELEILKKSEILESSRSEKINELEYRINSNKALLKSFEKIQKENISKLEKAQRQELILNNVLNKFTDQFFNLAQTADNLLKVRDLFEIRDANRTTSFFATNNQTTLSSDYIKKQLIKLVNKDNPKKQNAEYIDAVTTMFTKFKKELINNVLPNLDTINTKLQNDGVMALSNPQLLLTLKNGTIPDEVIFAMMLSTMHWAAINKNISRNMPRYKIAAMLFGDPKQTYRIRSEQYDAFKDAGMSIRNATRDISNEILDILNIKGKNATEDELFVKLDLAKIDPSFNEVFTQDAIVAKRTGQALALLSIEAARFLALDTSKLKTSNNINQEKRVKGKNVSTKTSGVIVKGGFFQFHHGRYDPDLFDDSEEYLVDSKSKKIVRNTLIVRDTPATNKVLDVFKDNVNNLEAIKGSQSYLKDIFDKPVKEVQETVRDGFYPISDEHKSVVTSLQNVKHKAKENLYPLFNALTDTTLLRLNNYKNLDEVHDEKLEGKKAANTEIVEDLAILRDFVANSKNKGFYYRWNVMKQGRFQIISNTINQQRSKLMRDFFYSDNPSTVNTDMDRAVFKLAVAQAFGFKLTTLKAAELQFEMLRDTKTSVGAIIDEILKVLKTENNSLDILKSLPKEDVQRAINEGDLKVTNDKLNTLINELIDEGTIKTTMRVLEGLVALSEYNPESFVSTIYLEMDGTTNGYAIGLLQFAVGKPEELVEQFARIGINAQPGDIKDTFEKFIARGELDVYQFFSDTFYKELTKPSEQTKEELGTETLANIEVLHGKFYDMSEESGLEKLSSFARDIAKSPVMISNYGAGTPRVISNVIASIIPDLYDKLAEFQTEFNNATTNNEKKEVVDKVRAIQRHINLILKDRGLRGVNLVNRLNKKGSTENRIKKTYKNNLYGFVFADAETQVFNKYFKDLYTNAFTNTLDTLLGPLKESSDLVVQAAEIMYFGFVEAYNDAITYVDPKTNKSKKISSLATKLLVAKELKELMPQLKGYIYSEKSSGVLELINTKPELDGKYSIQIFNKGIAAPVEEKTKNWETIENRKFTTLETLTFTPNWDSPGVGAVIRAIQNRDSVGIGKIVKANPKGMLIHDAKTSSINDVVNDATILNEWFLEDGLNNRILDEMRDALETFLVKIKNKDPEYLNRINDLIQTKSHKITTLKKRLKVLKSISPITTDVAKNIKDTETEIDDFIRFVNIESIQEKLVEQIAKVNEAQSKIDLKNARSSQFYVPESVFDKSTVPTIVKKDQAGQESIDDTNNNIVTDSSAVEETPLTLEDIAKLNAEIESSQGDLKNTNLTPNNINTVPFVWEPLAKLEQQSKSKLIELAKRIQVPIENNATKEKIIQRITDSQNGLPQEPIAPIKPKFTNNKAFINRIKRMGGINPNSTLGKELKAQDITNKQMPGLFRNDSTTGELDGIPVNELIDDGLFADDDGSGYADYDWIFDRIVGEVSGELGLNENDQLINDQYENQLQQYEEEKAEYNKKKLLDNNADKLGSLLGSLEEQTTEDLKKIYTSTDLRSNLINIFESIGKMHTKSYFSEEDKSTQETHLKRVLDEIIAKAGPILDKTVVTLNKGNIKTSGHANITNNSVNVNINKFLPKSYSQQNGQEVYTHELIHILTRFILKNNPEFRRNVKRIREQVKAQIEKTEKNPYEIFLHRDSDGNIISRRDEASEIEAAKEQYDYVFVRPPADAVLDEFLAYALTNKFLVNTLKSMPSESIPLWSKDSTDNVVEKLFTMFAEMIKRFKNLLERKNKPANLEEEIFQLTKEVIEVNQSKRSSLANAVYLDKAGGIADQGNAILSDFIKRAGTKGLNIAGDKYNNMVDALTRQGKIDNFVADVLYDSKLMTLLTAKNQELIENNSEIQRVLARIYGSFRPGSLKILSSLKTDILGDVNQDFIKLLYKSNKVVDANRRAHKEITQKQLKKVFKDYKSLTEEDKRAITRVLLKTDLSVLVDTKEFTIEEVMEIIKNPDVLQNKIDEYKKGLTPYQLLQSEGLSDYMVTNKTFVNNLYLNANNIYISKPLRGKSKSKKDEIIKQIDIFVSLLALQKVGDESKKMVTVIQEREFGLNSTHNGIHALINLHMGFKRDSLERAFKNNPVLMQKGYIAQVTDSDAALRVELSNVETQIRMKSEGYQFIGNFHNIAGLKGENWGLYVIKNDPDLTRTKGVLSMTGMVGKGTNFMTINARDESSPGQLKAKLNKFTAQQLIAAQLQEAKQQTSANIDKTYKMIPLVDEDLNIVNYRFNLRQNEFENYLKQNLSFEEVLPTMYSQIEDRINSELINEEAIKLMDQYRKKAYSKNPKGFINILSADFKEEYFDHLPKQAKYEIMQRATFDNKTGKDSFLVERGFLDTIFGYVTPSISSLVPKKLAKKSATARKTQRYLKISEKFVKEMVNMATVNIVIKIPIVPAANFTSNFITSWAYGVPPDYLVKKWYEGIKELKDYRLMANELKLLDLEVLSNPALKNSSALKLKRATLVADMNKNKVAWFIDEGLFNSITEDINQNEYSYRNKMLNKLKEKGGKLVTGKVTNIANQAYIGEHTAIFKASMHFLQISDFIARYALYKYQTEEKGMDKKEAYQLMIQTFVNYDQPLNRYLGYTNDMGLILFVKYWMRIQRAGLHLMINKPLNAGIIFSGNSLLGLDIETILNSNLITGNFMPTIGGVEKILEEVFIPPGVEIMMLEGF